MRDESARMLRPATLEAYQRDWRIFGKWCVEHAEFPHVPVDPPLVAEFIEHERDRQLAPSTIKRRLVAISRIHSDAGYPSPCRSREVLDAMTEARRRHVENEETRTAAAARTMSIVIDAITDKTSIGLRDRALLAMYFTGVLGRTELAELNVEQLVWQYDTLTIRPATSTGHGLQRPAYLQAISAANGPPCAVVTLRRYITATGLRDGPVFRRATGTGSLLGQRNGDIASYRFRTRSMLSLSRRGIAVIIARRAIAAKVDPRRVVPTGTNRV